MDLWGEAVRKMRKIYEFMNGVVYSSITRLFWRRVSFSVLDITLIRLHTRQKKFMCNLVMKISLKNSILLGSSSGLIKNLGKAMVAI